MLRCGGRSVVGASLHLMETHHPCHFIRPGGRKLSQPRLYQARTTDGFNSTFIHMAVWQIPSFYILIIYLACIGRSSNSRLACLFLRAVLEVHAKWELRICLLPDLGGQGWEVKHRWHTASSPKRKQELLISHCALREPLHSAARPISIPYWIMVISIRLSVRRVPFKHNMVVPEIP